MKDKAKLRGLSKFFGRFTNKVVTKSLKLKVSLEKDVFPRLSSLNEVKVFALYS